MIIAVDFDGTIVEHEYPKIGKEKIFATETLRQLIADSADVAGAWDLAGRTGLMLRVICRDMASFQALVEAFQQVSTTESYFCLHQRKGAQLPLEDV